MKKILENKIFKFSLYFILVTILLWGILNSASYLIVETYLNRGYFKEKIIEKLDLSRDYNYILEAQFGVNWSPFLLNTRLVSFRFYDEKQKVIDIMVKDAIFGFSITKLASGNFIPTKIKLSNGSIYLAKEFFMGYGLSPKLWKEKQAAALRLWKGNEGENYIDQDKDQIDDREESFFKYISNIKSLDLKNIIFKIPSLLDKNNDKIVNHFVEKFNMRKAVKKIKMSLNYNNDEFVKNLESKFTIKLFPKKHQFNIVEHETKINLANIPHLPQIKMVSFNIFSKSNIFFKKNFLVDKIDFDILDLNGKILQKDRTELNINKSNLLGNFNSNNNQINLNLASINFNGGLVHSNNFSLSKNNIKGDLTIKNIQAHDLIAIWPDNFFADTKEWYQKAIKKGEADSGRLKLNLAFEDWHFIDNKSQFLANINVKNVDLLCCGQKFPLVKNIVANLNINLHQLTANITEAHLGYLKLNKAKAILNLNNNDLTINGSSSGQLSEFVKVYDPNYSINILGENIVKNIAGDGIANFILKTNLGIKQDGEFIIDQTINLTSKNFSTHLQEKKLNIHDGDVKFNLKNQSIKLDINGFLNNNKFIFNSEIPETHLNQNSDISAEHKTKLIVDYQAIKHIAEPIIGNIIEVDKMIEVDATVINKTNGDIFYDVNLDLYKTTLLANYIKLKKPVGMMAKASFKLLYTLEDAYFLSDLEMILAGQSIIPKIFSNAKPLNLDTNTIPFMSKAKKEPLSNKRPFHKITVDNVNYINDNTEIYKVKFNDNEIDFINFISEPCRNNLYISADKIYYHDFDWLAFGSNDESKENDISGKIKSLILADNLLIKDLDLDIACDKQECYSMKLNNLNQLGKGVMLDAELVHKVIKVHSDNAGLILRGLDITKYITGGKLFLEGHLNEYPDKEIMLENALHITNFQVHKAPPMAHLLALASPSGIISGLTGKGMSFSKFDSNFIFLNDKVQFAKSIADGSALALAFQGFIDIDKSLMDINGSIIPFNIINIILRKIPIIGEWLVGKPGEGLITINFEVNGSLDKPDFKVNPFKIFIPHTIKKCLEKQKQNEAKLG